MNVAALEDNLAAETSSDFAALSVAEDGNAISDSETAIEYKYTLIFNILFLRVITKPLLIDWID
ncbi:hypothetical protein [Vibrio sp. WXL103]|uniref:hypothetical protein n=1 Tax=Vibrio sp. WXL103 TaxID=3450710 RepID=UPI003EC74AB7